MSEKISKIVIATKQFHEKNQIRINASIELKQLESGTYANLVYFVEFHKDRNKLNPIKMRDFEFEAFLCGIDELLRTQISAYTLMHDARFSHATSSVSQSTLTLECKEYKNIKYYYINYYNSVQECGVKFTIYELQGFFNSLTQLSSYSNDVYFKQSTKLSIEAMNAKSSERRGNYE